MVFWQSEDDTYGVDCPVDTIKYFAYICLGLAGVGLIVTLAEEPAFIVPTLVLLVTGVLLTALDKIITTLVEIRDVLKGKNDVGHGETASVSKTEPAEQKPTRSAKEIGDDLKRLKDRAND